MQETHTEMTDKFPNGVLEYGDGTTRKFGHKDLTFNYAKYTLPRRRRLKALGLTVNGKPLKVRLWPQLAGLKGREYGVQYMRLRRREQ